MSFDKSIKSGKEHRKMYTGPKAIDTTCRNHGSCIYCKNNRLYKYNKKNNESDMALKEYRGMI